MLQQVESTFLSPTRESRRLFIMLAIHNDSQVSQHRIARITGISSAMVNNYIKQLQQQQLITVTGSNNRTQNYYLTKSGRKQLRMLLQLYSAEIGDIYGSIQDELGNIRRIADALA